MKRPILWILILCLLFGCTGCNKASGAGEMIYFEGDTIPDNVDPLLARSASELVAVQQLFEPLLTVVDGSFVPLAASGYTVSTDGKAYTFTLRDGLCWSDGQAVTAVDFVFALQRAADPATKAACAGQLSTVAGVESVQKGTASSDTIGVVAVDAKTFTVSLTTADAGILTALCGVAGMPCRKAFFESCGGRYGMGKEYLVGNGAFCVERWSTNEKDLFLQLGKNEHYWNAASVLPAGLIMRFQGGSGRLTRMADGDIDCGNISGDNAQAATDAGLQLLPYYSDSYGLLFNTGDDHPTADVDLRKAMVGGVDWTGFAAHLPAWYEAGESMFTPGKYCGATVYTSKESGRALLTGEMAHTAFEAALERLDAEALNDLELCYVEESGIRSVLDFLVQCWQKEFGLYVTLTAVSEYELEARAQTGNFDLILCSMGNAGRSTLEVLEQFSSKSGNLRGGFGDKAFESLLKKAKNAGGDDVAWQQQCEQQLRSTCVVMPLFYQKEYFAYRSKLSGLVLDGYTKILSFSNVGKLR